MDMYRSLSEIEDLIKAGRKTSKLVLSAADDLHALEAVVAAKDRGVIDPILIGNSDNISKIGKLNNIDLRDCEIIDEKESSSAIEKSIRLIKEGSADILMKGKSSTAALLKGILNKEWGMRSGKLLSHFALFEVPQYHKLLALTDVAINITPDLNDKASITENAVAFMNRLGWDKPKVAVIAAVEVVNEAMQATTDAAGLSMMANRGQLKNCLIDGPMAIDGAINAESARNKGINSEVAGDADLLVFPQLESGNVMYKTLAFLTDSSVASVVLGAAGPVVLTSRSDSNESKLNSIILAAAAGALD
jgi:phosphate butyryltransferase